MCVLNIQDKLKVTLWNKKCTKYYENAINTWTVRDPLKRKTAKEDELRLHSEIPFFFKMMESKKMFEIDDYLDGIEINNLIIDQRIRVSTR